MYPSVRSAWVAFNAPLEGVVPFFYLDILGLTTCAIGILVDSSVYSTEPPPWVLNVPFIHPGGAPATKDEIREDWKRVKARQDMKTAGGFAFGKVAQLRLTPKAIEEVVGRKLDELDAAMAARFPGWPTWPADAQCGVLSMCWAMGSNFRFPKFTAACKARDWVTAAAECKMTEAGNPGIVDRNKRNLVLFKNAHEVDQDGGRSVLHYPRALGT